MHSPIRFTLCRALEWVRSPYYFLTYTLTCILSSGRPMRKLERPFAAISERILPGISRVFCHEKEWSAAGLGPTGVERSGGAPSR